MERPYRWCRYSCLLLEQRLCEAYEASTPIIGTREVNKKVTRWTQQIDAGRSTVKSCFLPSTHAIHRHDKALATAIQRPGWRHSAQQFSWGFRASPLDSYLSAIHAALQYSRASPSSSPLSQILRQHECSFRGRNRYPSRERRQHVRHHHRVFAQDHNGQVGSETR